MAQYRQQFFSLSEDVLEGVEVALNELLTQSKARCCMVIDRSGCLVLQCGRFDSLHPEEMSAVGAGVFAALQSLVNMTESHELTVNFHTPNLDNIHFQEINKRMILAVIYRFYEVSEEVIREQSTTFVAETQPMLSGDETDVVSLGSIKFISKKLDELFEA